MDRKIKKIKYASHIRTGTDFIMGCPFCGFEYNHIEGIQKQDGKDNYSTEYGDIFRGDAVVLGMTCENGHTYKIVFGNHKGYLYLFAEKSK